MMSISQRTICSSVLNTPVLLRRLAIQYSTTSFDSLWKTPYVPSSASPSRFTASFSSASIPPSASTTPPAPSLSSSPSPILTPPPPPFASPVTSTEPLVNNSEKKEEQEQEEKQQQQEEKQGRKEEEEEEPTWKNKLLKVSLAFVFGYAIGSPVWNDIFSARIALLDNEELRNGLVEAQTQLRATRAELSDVEGLVIDCKKAIADSRALDAAYLKHFEEVRGTIERQVVQNALLKKNADPKGFEHLQHLETTYRQVFAHPSPSSSSSSSQH